MASFQHPPRHPNGRLPPRRGDPCAITGPRFTQVLHFITTNQYNSNTCHNLLVENLPTTYLPPRQRRPVQYLHRPTDGPLPARDVGAAHGRTPIPLQFASSSCSSPYNKRGNTEQPASLPDRTTINPPLPALNSINTKHFIPSQRALTKQQPSPQSHGTKAR